MELDEKDRIILESLFKDCRISLKELSRRTSLTHPAVSNRILKYESEGIIRRYDIIPNLNKLKTPIYIILVAVPSSMSASFEEYCLKNKSLLTLVRQVHKFNYSITSPLDEQDFNDLKGYLEKNGFEYRVFEISKQVPLEYQIFNNNIPIRNNSGNSDVKVNIDDTDLKVLGKLSNGGGRLSMLELARELDLSPDLVVYRFKKLKNAGYFARYVAQPGLDKFYLKYIMVYIKVKGMNTENVKRAFSRSWKTLLFFEAGDGVYLATLIIRSFSEFESALDVIYDELGRFIVEFELYIMKDWVFLNRLDLNF